MKATKLLRQVVARTPGAAAGPTAMMRGIASGAVQTKPAVTPIFVQVEGDFPPGAQTKPLADTELNATSKAPPTTHSFTAHFLANPVRNQAERMEAIRRFADATQNSPTTVQANPMHWEAPAIAPAATSFGAYCQGNPVRNRTERMEAIRRFANAARDSPSSPIQEVEQVKANEASTTVGSFGAFCASNPVRSRAERMEAIRRFADATR